MYSHVSIQINQNIVKNCILRYCDRKTMLSEILSIIGKTAMYFSFVLYVNRNKNNCLLLTQSNQSLMHFYFLNMLLLCQTCLLLERF